MKVIRFSLLVFASLAFAFSLAGGARAQTVNFLAQFSGAQETAVSVIQAADGNFYGATSVGSGEIFRMTPAGDITTIHIFCSLPGCPDGSFLVSSPVLGSDGNLYGVASNGGNSTGSGTFYRMTREGQFTVLYSFCPSSGCSDGQYPNGVVAASDGNFYGTAEGGGEYGHGTIFRMSPSGQLEVLHAFCSQTNCTDGANPGYAPIQGSDGNFYGVAGAGILGGGVVYKMTPSGTYTVLHGFCEYQDGVCPAGSDPVQVVKNAQGNLIGATTFGGNRYGTIFQLTTSGKYTLLQKLDSLDGSNPFYGLTMANDGNVYGTGSGGNYGYGALFEVTPAGAVTPIYSFNCCSEGYYPDGPLFQGTDGHLYGVTLYGPATVGTYGMIFTLANNFSPLVETVPAGGSIGQSILILGNNLTGSTSVTFNGMEASFTVESDTYIKATVPSGATTGVVSVVTPSGTLISNPQFVVAK